MNVTKFIFLLYLEVYVGVSVSITNITVVNVFVYLAWCECQGLCREYTRVELLWNRVCTYLYLS